jgi:hypothetical protein
VIRVLALACLLSACTPVQPGPAPTPRPVAGDLFAGKVLDCARPYAYALPMARTCADAGDIGPCMVAFVERKDATPDAIACAARDEQQIIFVDIARGTATEQQRGRAQRLRTWFLDRGMTLRGAP